MSHLKMLIGRRRHLRVQRDHHGGQNQDGSHPSGCREVKRPASLCRVTLTVATIRTAAIPQLVADLSALDGGYRGVQPCIAALLARIALIDQNVIAIPSSAIVRCCRDAA